METQQSRLNALDNQMEKDLSKKSLRLMIALAFKKNGATGVLQLDANVKQIETLSLTDRLNFKNRIESFYNYVANSPLTSHIKSIEHIGNEISTAPASVVYQYHDSVITITIENGIRTYQFYNRNENSCFSTVEELESHLKTYANTIQTNDPASPQPTLTRIDAGQITTLPFKLEEGLFIAPDMLFETTEPIDSWLEQLKKSKLERKQIFNPSSNDNPHSPISYPTTKLRRNTSENYREGGINFTLNKQDLQGEQALYLIFSKIGLISSQATIGIHSSQVISTLPKGLTKLGGKIGLKVVRKTIDKSSSLFGHLAKDATIAKLGSQASLSLFHLLNVGYSAKSFATSTKNFIEAKTNAEAKIYGTQFAFDTAGLSLSVVTAGATLAGSSLATPLAIAGIPLIITGILVVEKVQFYALVKDFVEAHVENYFKKIDHAYQEGYQYTDTNYTLIIASGAVVTKINLEHGVIEFGSQLLLPRSNHDKTVVSPSNHADEELIHLRSVLRDDMSTDNRIKTIDSAHQNAEVIILPDTPFSYISYDTANTYATTTWKFPTIQKIEQNSNKQFELEYWHNDEWYTHPKYGRIRNTSSLAQKDNFISKLFHHYRDKEVEVILGSNNRTLVIPNLPDQTANTRRKGSNKYDSTDKLDDVINYEKDSPNHNHILHPLENSITYNLVGKGGQYVIGLNELATVKLTTEGQTPSRWILDCTNLESDTFSIAPDQLIIGGMRVNINPEENINSEVTIIEKNGNVSVINLATKNKTLIQTTADQWNLKSKKEIESHLLELAKTYSLSQAIIINNYIHHNVEVGRAYLNPKTKAMQFNDRAGQPLHLLSDIERILNDIENTPLLHVLQVVTTYTTFKNLAVTCGTGFYKYPETVHTYSLQSASIDAINTCLSYWKKQQHTFSSEDNLFYTKLEKWVTKLAQTADAWSEKISNASADVQQYSTWTKEESSSKKTGWIIEFDNEVAELTQELNQLFIEANRISGIDNTQQDYYKKQKALFLDAQIGHNGETHTIWYNLNEALIWSIDNKTGQIVKQYSFNNEEVSLQWHDLKDINFSEKNGQLYVTYNLYEKNNKHTHQKLRRNRKIEYLLNDDGMQLTKLHSYLTSHPQIRNNNNQPSFTFNNTIPTINTTHAPIISRYYEDIGTPNLYWQLNNEKRIYPNLPHLPEEQLKYIELASIMTHKGASVFYFFDPINHHLYRQKGTTVTRILNQENIDGIYESDGKLLIVTDKGFINQVDNNGEMILKGVSEKWITFWGDDWFNSHGNWYQQLNSLDRDYPIVIHGIKNAKMEILPAWYYKQKLIIMAHMPGALSLKLLDADSNGEFFYFLNETTQKLYKQRILDQYELYRAFDDNHVLDTSYTIKAPIPLFEESSFVSSSVSESGIIKLITNQGAILQLDADTAHLVGFDYRFLKNQETNKPTESADTNMQPVATLTTLLNSIVTSPELQETIYATIKDGEQWIIDKLSLNDGLLLAARIHELAQEWNFNSEAVLLHNTGNTKPRWYHTILKKVIIADNLTQKDEAEYVGMLQEGDATTIYINSKQGSYSYTHRAGSITSPTAVPNELIRIQDELRTLGTEQADTLSPLELKDVETHALFGGEGADTYQIDQAKKALKVYIHNFSKDKTMDTLQLKVENLNNLYFQRGIDIDNKLEQTDNLFLLSENSSIAIMNAFSSDSESYNHLTIHISDDNKGTSKQFDVANLVDYIKRTDTMMNEHMHYQVTGLDHLYAPKNI